MKLDKSGKISKYLSKIKPRVATRSIKLNDIVSLRSHPYQISYTDPKIGAYAKFTPPLMIVIEILNKSTYDVITGQRNPNQYNCLFYSTKEGKFEKLWFKGEELKLIDEHPDEDFGDDSRSVHDLKKKLVGKEVVLKTVDLELGKQKTFQDIVDGHSKMKDSALLDYLPPVASIMDIKYEEGHTKYNEKTGTIAGNKLALQAKIKWLNNESGRFSEDTVPLKCLKLVEFNNNDFLFDAKKIYLLALKDPKELESNPKLYYKAYPIYLNSVTFKHYYYTFSATNLFSKQTTSFLHNFPVDSFFDFDQLLKDGLDLGDQVSIQSYFKQPDHNEFKDKWFKVLYKDREENITERIIYVLSLESGDNDDPESASISLRCNCLLRSGAIRNFRVERILKCIKLSDEFEEAFFQRV